MKDGIFEIGDNVSLLVDKGGFKKGTPAIVVNLLEDDIVQVDLEECYTMKLLKHEIGIMPYVSGPNQIHSSVFGSN